MAGVSPVSQGTLIAEVHPDVLFYFARLSHNSYVGKGGTDKGNRLFGTPDGAECGVRPLPSGSVT